MPGCLVIEDLGRLVRGELTPENEAQARDHISSCQRCRAEHEKIRSGGRLGTATLSIAEPDSETSGRLDVTGTSPTAAAARHFPKIEGYQIAGILGQGGMGIVYRAVQTNLNRTVALKVLPAIVGTASPSAVSRFRREATAAARLHHTHIIPIYDFGESRDAHYYAMELISGAPLNVLIRRFAEQDVANASPVRLSEMLRTAGLGATAAEIAGESSGSSGDSASSGTGASTTGRGRVYFQQIARWMMDTANALDYAHGEHVIHRDIKPANLILSDDGRIMIGDFGLAKSVGDESVTMTGALVGTLRYVSPEQAMAKRVRVDHRTDIYSLGATMYELLCFKPAFPGDDEKEILGAIIARDPIRPRKIVPSVPHELETICLKTLEKNPDHRYATARELAEDLRRYMHDLPIQAKRPGPLARSRKFFRRHRSGVVAVAALVLVVAVAIPTVFLARAASEREALAREAADMVTMAQVYARDKRWTEAAAQYQEALDVDPENFSALSNFARMKKEQYNVEFAKSRRADASLLDEAVELCDRALKVDADHTALWNTKGVLLKKLKRYDDAILAYGKALDLEPGNGPAWENLGIAQALSGYFDNAEENIRRAADLAGTKEFECEYPWRNLAALNLHLGKAEAVEHLKQAMACNKKDAATLSLTARMFLELDGHTDVQRAVENAGLADYEADGNDPVIKRVRALAHLEDGDWTNAKTFALEAIERRDDLAAADHFIIAIAEAKLGQFDAAREAYQEAQDAWPADLNDPTAVRVTATAGILWFESGERLAQLRDRADSVLTEAQP